MIAATRPRPRGEARLLHIDPCGRRFDDRRVTALPELLRAGDLLVVNDAATVPASIRDGGLEVRLAGPIGEIGDGLWRAVLFGAGDWRQPTELRPAPPVLAAGTRLGWGAEIVAVSTLSPRLVTLRLDPGVDLYTLGRPVQYSYVDVVLDLWDVQTAYGARPWAVEPPSAGLSLDAATLLSLRRAGVALATLTHAAGLSSTGDPAIDAALPFPERYDIPAVTVAAVAAARRRGGRVVAVGTTVVRALEGAVAANGGVLAAGSGVTDLKLGPGSDLAVVDGLLTGIHEPGSSHLALLRAFVASPVLPLAVPLIDAAYAHAAASGYRGHELGDTSLVLCA